MNDPGADTDELRDRKTLRNLLDWHDGGIPTGEELRLTGGNSSSIDETLASIDEVEPPEALPVRRAMPDTLRKIIADGLVEAKQYYQKNRSSYLDARRSQARRDYAAQKAAIGQSVRSYTRHPEIPGESAAERDKRLRREARCRRTGRDETTLNSYLDRSGMTEEEKQARKRQQDSESKARRRAAHKSLKQQVKVARVDVDE